MNGAELQQHLRRSFQAFEDKWVGRCSAPLTLVFVDGSEKEISPPHRVNFENPFHISYEWDMVRLTKDLAAVRFDGAGRPASITTGIVHIAWDVKIEWQE